MLYSDKAMSSDKCNCVACGKSTGGGNHECSWCGNIVHNSPFSYDASLLGGNLVEYCSMGSIEEEEMVTCKLTSSVLATSTFDLR